jgi:YL1 nuclear protein C-terminal domain
VLLARPRERCPITGLAAKYCDPRTGVPYANVHAFKEISNILDHEYVWNEQFGCYVGRNDESEIEDDSGSDEGGNQEHAMEV